MHREDRAVVLRTEHDERTREQDGEEDRDDEYTSEDRFWDQVDEGLTRAREGW